MGLIIVDISASDLPGRVHIRKLAISLAIDSAVTRGTAAKFDKFLVTCSIPDRLASPQWLGPRLLRISCDTELGRVPFLVFALLKTCAMIASLKADLHIHTHEGELAVPYTAREVIARAAREGYRVLSISNHDLQTYSDDLAAYARDLGILLIPGVEATVEGRHVLVYNADVGVDKLQTFADLHRYRTPEWLVIAPHPFFPASYCLRERLWKEIDLFDAIEFSHFYTTRVDFNRAAVKLAGAVGLPMLGTSDSHLEEQLGTTFSLIEAEPTIESVLSAIRKGRVSVVSRPLSLVRCARIFWRLTLATLAAGTRLTPDRRPGAPLDRSPRAAASARR